jgi:hypothetical protein
MLVDWRERDWVHLREALRDDKSGVWGPLAACGLLMFFACSLLREQDYLL